MSAPATDDLREALTSARRLVTGDRRDWTADRHDAFLYGLFRGWDHPQASAPMVDVAARHDWDEAFVARLRRLSAAVDRAIDGPV